VAIEKSSASDELKFRCTKFTTIRMTTVCGSGGERGISTHKMRDLCQVDVAYDININRPMGVVG